MSTEVLEPKLTVYDRKVLGAIPACGQVEWHAPSEAISIWRLAEALEEMDLGRLRTELNGLVHLGYAQERFSRHRGRRVYWRTRKGDGAVG